MNHLGRDLATLLGEDEAVVARRVISESLKEDKTAVETLKADIIKNFEYLTDAEKEKRIEEHAPELAFARFKTGEVGKAENCPCCKNKGWLVGDVTGKRPPSIDGREIVSRFIVTPKLFSCQICRFKINSYGKLRIVKLADQFEYTESLDPVEYFGIEIMDYIDEDDLRDYLGDEGY